MKELIEVHCVNTQLIVCDCCDSYAVETKLYYRISKPKDHFESSRRYLKCCKDKIGKVIDWEEKIIRKQNDRYFY